MKKKTNAVLDEALAYAKLGWRVFPLLAINQQGGCECQDGVDCTRPGKHPAIQGWNKEASTDSDQIREWWVKHPSRGIGIATGEESDLTVLDADGNEGLMQIGEFFRGTGIPTTPTVQSRPGHQHYYFAHNPDIKSKSKNLGSHLDTRSNDGFVVAPPSRHASGTKYEWLTHPSKAEVAPWPTVLSEKKPEQKPEAAQRETFNPANSKDVEKLISALPYLDWDDEKTWSDAGRILGRAFRQSDAGYASYRAGAASSKKFDEKKTKGHYYEQSKKPYSGRIQTVASIYAWAMDRGWQPPIERIFDKSNSTLDLSRAAPAPRFLIENYMPDGTVGGMVGEGGVNKTSVAMYEAVHIILGRPFLGHRVIRPGSVLFVTAEDDKALMRYRIQQIINDMGLLPEEVRKVQEGLHVEDLSGSMRRLVAAYEHGRLAPSGMGDELILEYRKSGIVLINFDPTNLFGPGESFVNDGEAALMVEGMRIARELGCTVRFVHHIGKNASREQTVDAYVGRGGSAFADNSRFMHLLMRHTDEKRFSLPPQVSKQAMQKGLVLRLHTTKLSWGPRPMDPIFLLRDGFNFRHYNAEQQSHEERQASKDKSDRQRVWEFIHQKRLNGIKLTPTELGKDHRFELGLSRDATTKVVSDLLQAGHLINAELPRSEWRGQRKTFLDIGTSPNGKGA